MKKTTARVDRYLQNNQSQNTRRAYEGSWESFSIWSARNNLICFPASPETVSDYLAYLADEGKTMATIRMHRAAIGDKHRHEDRPDPTNTSTVKVTLSGISKTIGNSQNKKSPILMNDLRRMINVSPDTLMGIRDRAIILVGFAGAFRRSELVGLQVGDLKFGKELKILVRHSKTDQDGKGMIKVIPPLPSTKLDPVLSIKTWLSCSGIKSGPIFRRIDRWDRVRREVLSDDAVAIIIKRYAVLVGLDPRMFSGHSLRSGFITAAAEAGMPAWAIMEQTGHKSNLVMQGYIRDSGRGAERAVRSIFGETK